MADPVTMSDVAALAKDHSDIRREAAEHTNEIVKEGIKGDYATQTAITDTRYDVITNAAATAADLSKQVDAIDDTLTGHLFTISRESADNRAQIMALGFQVRDGFVANAKDTEISTLRSTLEAQKNTQYLSDRISTDGEKTRAMLVDFKNSDLNRMLIERNTEIVEERGHGRHWRGAWDQSQFAALQSQFQSLNSQFAETRQGMVNFGTMAGVGQTSTSNNVR